MKLDRIDGPDAITFTVKGSLTGLAESAIKLFEQISKDIAEIMMIRAGEHGHAKSNRFDRILPAVLNQ